MFDKQKFESVVLGAEFRDQEILNMEINNMIQYLEKARVSLCMGNNPDATYMEQAGMKMPELMKRAAEICMRHTYRVCIMRGDFDSKEG